MTAYYNENDAFAASWLRELIKAGVIAQGDVDERSIKEVKASDVRGYTQCHFFAGIGVWSYALISAGWPTDRPVWTGSCPCQPFSAAGKKGGFDDARHLWPDWFRLIGECRPDTVFGEQVASKDGLTWFDLVSTDLEGEDYTVGAADLCAAGFGAPHIRQRLYFVGHADDTGPQGRRVGRNSTDKQITGQASVVGGLENARSQSAGRRLQRPAESIGSAGIGASNQFERSGDIGVVADTDGGNSSTERVQRSGQHGQQPQDGSTGRGATSGFWSQAEWIPCIDGKSRPTKPGLFPLAHGVTNRVGKLRGYGNALCAEVAKGFVEAYLEISDKVPYSGR